MTPLTEYRLKLHLTQEKLALKAGIATRTIVSAENNPVHQLRYSSKRALLKALGLEWSQRELVFPSHPTTTEETTRAPNKVQV